jgi:hypothetical protein
MYYLRGVIALVCYVARVASLTVVAKPGVETSTCSHHGNHHPVRLAILTAQHT